jgi:hypothetical protein
MIYELFIGDSILFYYFSTEFLILFAIKRNFIEISSILKDNAPMPLPKNLINFFLLSTMLNYA